MECFQNTFFWVKQPFQNYFSTNRNSSNQFFNSNILNCTKLHLFGKLNKTKSSPKSTFTTNSSKSSYTPSNEVITVELQSTLTAPAIASTINNHTKTADKVNEFHEQSRELKTISSFIEKFREVQEKQINHVERKYSVVKFFNKETCEILPRTTSLRNSKRIYVAADVNHELFIPCQGFDKFYENNLTYNQTRSSYRKYAKIDYCNGYGSFGSDDDYEHNSSNNTKKVIRNDCKRTISAPPRRRRRKKSLKYPKTDKSNHVKDPNIYEDVTSKKFSPITHQPKLGTHTVPYDNIHYSCQELHHLEKTYKNLQNHCRKHSKPQNVKKAYSMKYLGENLECDTQTSRNTIDMNSNTLLIPHTDDDENHFNNFLSNQKRQQSLSFNNLATVQPILQRENSKSLCLLDGTSNIKDESNYVNSTLSYIENRVYMISSKERLQINGDNNDQVDFNKNSLRNHNYINSDEDDEILVCESIVHPVIISPNITINNNDLEPKLICQNSPTYKRFYSDSLYDDNRDRKSMSSFEMELDRIPGIKVIDKNLNEI